jgi:hypothetical protein
MSEFLTDDQMAGIEDKKRLTKDGKPNALSEALMDDRRGVETKPPAMAKSDGFLTDAEMAALADDDAKYGEAADVLRAGGRGIGSVLHTVDKYTMAPVRAGIGSLVGIETKPEKATALSYMIPGAALGERYGDNAPSMKQIYAKMGMSEDEFPIPLNADPTGRKMRVSPAGLAGGLTEAAMDPTNLLGIGEMRGAVAAMDGAEKIPGILGRGIEMGNDFGESVGNFARERAVKAATGEGKSFVKKIAKVQGQSPGDVRRAMENLHNAGDILLEPDANFGGKPAVGWFSTAKGIGENAAEREKFYGKKIGEVGETVDRLNPGGVTREGIASDVDEYGKKIPKLNTGDATRRRVFEESHKIRNHDPRGVLSEEEIALGVKPDYPLTFKEAQDMKGAYKYKYESPDMIESNQDATNKIKGAIGKNMDRAVEGAKTSPAGNILKRQTADAIRGLKADLGPLSMSDIASATEDQLREYSRLLDESKAVAKDYKEIGPVGIAKEDLSRLSQYPAYKQRYGTYSDVADAGANQALNTLNRNILSPSSKLAAATEFLADVKTGGLYRAGKAGTTAVMNQAGLSMGNAFAARAANAISRKIIGSTNLYRKFLPAFQAAAAAGNTAVVGLHHQLMNNDPEYRKLMLSSEEP